MPGKVNPTQCEALTMVCVQVTHPHLPHHTLSITCIIPDTDTDTDTNHALLCVQVTLVSPPTPCIPTSHPLSPTPDANTNHDHALLCVALLSLIPCVQVFGNPYPMYTPITPSLSYL